MLNWSSNKIIEWLKIIVKGTISNTFNLYLSQYLTKLIKKCFLFPSS